MRGRSTDGLLVRRRPLAVVGGRCSLLLSRGEKGKKVIVDARAWEHERGGMGSKSGAAMTTLVAGVIEMVAAIMGNRIGAGDMR